MSSQSGRAAFASTLANCAARDLNRRFLILHGEIGHLGRAIRQRMGYSQIGSGGESRHNRQSDEIAFLRRLQAASDQLASDIELGVENSGKVLAVCDDQWTERSLEEYRKLGLLTGGQMFSIEQAALRLKANVLSERIGNLHDRLDQFLERSNPDHPGPTRRRRSEQGVQDKYLSELARWMYRDLARLACDDEYMAERYPYAQTPVTFQFWDYARASRHHSYITTRGFEEWNSWKDTKDESRKTIDSSTKFTALRLPYWMPECPELHPIIAHELAHQVLRDFYGYRLHVADLERKGAGLSRMLRRLYRCVESWTSEMPESDSGPYRPLPIEIMCDAMAATRCGVAYLYALFIEMLDNDVLADLAKTHSGMLEPSVVDLPDADARKKRNQTLKMQSETLVNRQVTWLLRLYTTLGYVRKVFEPKGHDAQLCNDLELYLNEVLALYATGAATSSVVPLNETAYYQQVLKFSKDLTHALTILGRYLRRTPLLRAASAFWEKEPFSDNRRDFFLGRQVLGKAWRGVFLETLRAGQKSSSDEAVPVSTVDVPWRCIWQFVQSKDHLYSRLTNELLNAIDAAREEYVFRTANQEALFCLLGYEVELKGGGEALKSNSLNAAVKAAAHQEWELAFARLAENGVAQADPLFNGQFLRIGRGIASGVGAYRNERTAIAFPRESDVRRWIRPNSRYKLDLLSISTGNKRLCFGTPNMTSPGPVTKMRGAAIAASQILLGRYDAFALVARGEDEPAGESAYELRESNASYTSRRRNLIHTFTSSHGQQLDSHPIDVCERGKSAFAIVLLGLHYPGARLLFMQWLETQSTSQPSCLRFDAFLSDGWEDVTLLVGSQKSCARNDAEDFLVQFAKFVERLNGHPFVNVTETLLTSRIFELDATAAVVDVAFNCRINALSSRFPDAKAISASIGKVMDGRGLGASIEVRSLYGISDYRVTVKRWADLRQLGDVLLCLYDVPEISRLDTRVAIDAG